jgi:hypothetical protein
MWTYTGNPQSRDLDAVRFLIGDTDADDQQLQDAEINYLLSAHGSVNGAAIAAAEAVMAKYARKVDKAVGDLRISYSQRVEHYAKLVATLKRKVAITAVPFAGGISLSDKLAREQDDDRVPPAFTRDLDSVDEMVSADDDNPAL